jgi:hypothetical protein
LLLGAGVSRSHFVRHREGPTCRQRRTRRTLGPHPELAKRVAAVLASQERRLVEFIREGWEDGSVSSRVDAAVTARLLLCVVQGMRVLGKTGRSREEMASLVDSALKLLDR